MEVIVSTRNRNKFKEISKILKDSKIKAISLDHFPRAPRVKEDGKTLEENAAKKALRIAHFTKRLTVADDSGLMVDALNGAPGIYSARFAGNGATYKTNNEKLLKVLNGLPLKKRKARFICCVAVADEDGIVDIVKGIYPGVIAKQLKGRNGFGYDPLFISSRLGKTFAQLEPSVKNRISHRARAFAKAKKVILNYIKQK